MLNFLCFFCSFVLFIAVKTDLKLILHHMGKYFIIQLTEKKKSKSGGLHFLKVIFTTKELRDGPGFPEITETWVRIETR